MKKILLIAAAALLGAASLSAQSYELLTEGKWTLKGIDGAVMKPAEGPIAVSKVNGKDAIAYDYTVPADADSGGKGYPDAMANVAFKGTADLSKVTKLVITYSATGNHGLRIIMKKPVKDSGGEHIVRLPGTGGKVQTIELEGIGKWRQPGWAKATRLNLAAIASFEITNWINTNYLSKGGNGRIEIYEFRLEGLSAADVK